MLIRAIGVVGVAISGGLLAWYQTLGQAERRKADESAGEAAATLYHLALGQIPSGQAEANRISRHFN